MANTKITSRVIADDAIGASQLQDNAVTSDKIASNAVTSGKVLAGATGPQITAISGILAPDTAGNITITGVGFSSSNVFVDVGTTTALTAATSVTNTSSTSLTAAMPALSAGTYKVFVVNSDGKSAMFPQGFIVSVAPTWSTSAGALTGAITGTSYSVTVAASSDSTIAYSVASGALPSGITLNSSSGVISGTAPSDATSTTYNFTIRATDAEGQTADRAFSIFNLAVTKAFVFTGGSMPSGITHSRTESSAGDNTYLNSSGNVTYTGSAGMARFTHTESGTALGILLEESRINYMWDSDHPIGRGGWTQHQNSATWTTETGTTLPTGSTGDCSKMVTTGTSSSSYVGNYVWSTPMQNAGAGWYTYSFYMKRTAGNGAVRIRVYDGSGYFLRATFEFDGTTNNVTGGEVTSTAVGNGWYRVTCSGYTANTLSGSPAHVNWEYGPSGYGAQTTGGTYTASTVYIWGMQIENGRGATSYIPNHQNSSTTTKTRNSDYLRVDGTDWSNTITTASGRTYSAVLSGRQLGKETNAHVLHFKASGAYNGMIIKTNTNNVTTDTPYMNAYSTEGLNANVGNFTANADFKIAFVQSVAAGGTLGCLNGGSVGSSGTSYITPTQMTIGQYDTATGGFGFNGAVKYVYLFNSDIGTSTMQSLTS